jgi:hypothetical protein
MQTSSDSAEDSSWSHANKFLQCRRQFRRQQFESCKQVPIVQKTVHKTADGVMQTSSDSAEDSSEDSSLSHANKFRQCRRQQLEPCKQVPIVQKTVQKTAAGVMQTSSQDSNWSHADKFR